MKLLLTLILVILCPNVYADFNTGDTFGKGLIIQNNGTTLTGGGRTLNFASGVTVVNGAYFIQNSGGSGGSGTVTTVSVATANGFSGTVANPTTTPAITVQTTVTGLLKGDGTSVSAATSGTDYAPATTGSNLLFGNGSGGFTNVANSSTVGGNVGLGSANPGQILDVNGTVRAISLSIRGGTSSQFLKADGSTDSNTYITGNQTITLSGDVTGSGTTAITTTLKNTGTAGTYRSTTFDAQGRETSGTNPTTFSGYGISDSSANLRAALTDSTGTGVAVFGISPTISNLTGTGTVGLGTTNIAGTGLDVQGTVQTNSLISANLIGTDASGKLIANATSYSTAIGANPTATVGTTAINGSSVNFMRSDGAPAINQTISPTMTGNWTFAPSSGNTVFTAGNVGVGVGSPGAQLDVNGTVRMTGFTLTGNGAAAGFILQSNGSLGIGTWVPAPTGSSFSASANQVYYASSANATPSGATGFNFVSPNIGIGSATPGAILDVQGTVRVFGLVGIGTSTPVGMLDVEGTVNPVIFGGLSAGSTFKNVGIGTYSPGFMLDVAGGGRFLGTGNTTLNSTSGNVGIGTTLSLNKLDISGNVAIGVTYAGYQSAPSNGLVTQGNVGIGTTIFGTALTIKGVISEGSNPPTISSCGTSPNGSAVGNDQSFTITVGGTATSCTATFLGTYTAAHCNVSNQSLSVVNGLTYTESNTTLVFSMTGLSGDKLDVNCGFTQ